MDTTRRQRLDTPERRQAALDRAIAEGIEVRQLADSGEWIATSGSDPDVAYAVSLHACKCPAGEHDDPVCKHKEALRLKLAEQAIAEVETLGWEAPDLVIAWGVRAADWMIRVGRLSAPMPLAA